MTEYVKWFLITVVIMAGYALIVEPALVLLVRFIKRKMK